VFPQALLHVEKELQKAWVPTALLSPAKGKGRPIITENGNLILDCKFDESADTMERDIKSITGVIESGLFIGYNLQILVASPLSN
jgi:ribose 5-phosphate isomerase A